MLDIEAIRRLLPHRYPFLMVDRVLEQADGRVVAVKNVTVNEPYFQGHFAEPFEAIMPGVLILEAMAQTTAFLIPHPGEGRPREGYLVGVENARFRRKVVPGDRLRIEAERTRMKRGMLRADVRATVDGELAASATLSVLIAEGADEERS